MAPRLASLVPDRWENYVEPMAGSAALFFHLAPERAVLADINSELINFYMVLRKDTSGLVGRLRTLRASETEYEIMRKRNPTSKLERAVRFAYLNRLCWNGLHRVNRSGCFNVPMGDRLPERLWDTEELQRAAKLLQNATLVNGDFETTLASVESDSFVFLDPPYAHGAKGGEWFNRYSKDLFSIRDHERLGKVVEVLDKKGVSLMIVLGSHQELLQYYPSSFWRTRLRSKALISSKPLSRRTVNETVLVNYVPRCQ